MTEADLVKTVSRLITGAGALVPLAEFVRAYDAHRSGPKQSPQFASLSAGYGNDGSAVVPAIQLAREDSFFTPLWATLIERVGDALAADADAKQVTEALSTSAVGTMQRVMSAKGFRLVRSMPALLRAAKATGHVIITNDAGPPGHGTGFLVGPDLLITAAHVVDELIEDGAPKAGSANRILIEFHNQLESQGKWPVESRVVTNWLVALSPPLGKPPNLDSTTIPAAAARLDFALIRLAEKVGADIGYLDMRSPPQAEKNGPLTVIGYPGGDECLSDDNEIIEVDAAAGRVRHSANAVRGMSGSPCLDGIGKVVAIHEGAVETPPPYNRAIYLGSVRAAIKQGVTDPLETESGPLWALTDMDARREWIAAGQNRSTTEVDRALWLERVEPFNPASPAGAMSGDAFHPVFGRATFQRWIDEASAPMATRRIALMTGARTGGKSFSTAILRAKLRQTSEQIVTLGPEAVRVTSIGDVLDKVYTEAAAGSARVAGESAALRPQAGAARRDVIPDALDDLAPLVTTRPSGATRLWLAIDFGNDSTLTAQMAPQWKELLIQAAKPKYAWLRLVVIGMRDTRQREFAKAVPGVDAVFVESIERLEADHFQTCVEHILKSVAPEAPLAGFQATIDELWNAIDQLDSSQGRSVEAVRAALLFRRAAMEAANA